MLASQEFLKKSEQLSAQQFFRNWEPPVRVARGYADLGYEEFLLLPERKLVSLVNGKSSEFPESHEQLFFQVPGTQELVNEIDRNGFDIEYVRYQNQRSWEVSVCHASASIHIVSRHSELECALADTLIELTKRREPNQEM